MTQPKFSSFSDISDATPLPVTTVANTLTGASVSRSTAYEASRQAVATAAIFLGLIVHNSKASAQFIQVHDVSSAPADTAVPKEIFYVPAQTTVALDVSDSYVNGIYVCNSSTGPTKTIGSADCWFTVRYRNA